MEVGYEQWLLIGKLHAVRQDLDADLAEDCAIEFVEKMLRSNLISADGNEQEKVAWIHLCAKRFALNYIRSIARRNRHEVACSLLVDADTFPATAEDQDETNSPHAVVLRHEFWQQMIAAVNLLCPRQKTYLYRHHVRGETVQEIADAHHCTEHSVEQTLLRARQRLRILLLRRQWDEAGLREYLLPPSLLSTRSCEVLYKKYFAECVS